VAALALEIPEQAFERDVLQRGDVGAGELLQVRRRHLLGAFEQQILHVDDAQRELRVPDQGQPRQARVADDLEVLLPGRAAAEHLHAVAAAHRVADPHVAQVENVLEEQQAAEGHHARALGLGEEDAQLVLGMLVLLRIRRHASTRRRSRAETLSRLIGRKKTRRKNWRGREVTSAAPSVLRIATCLGTSSPRKTWRKEISPYSTTNVMVLAVGNG